MVFPRVNISCSKIRSNTETIVKLCGNSDIKVFGVTKVTCADLKVAEAMKSGGVYGFADSRIENIKKLRAHFGVDEKILMLRLPMISQAEDVVKFADYSLNSELSTIKKLSEYARKLNKRHGVILMVDIGDLREGVWPDAVEHTTAEILKLNGVKLSGLGVNLACYGGVFPTEENMNRFAGIVEEIQKKFSIKFELISGGNSSGLPFLTTGKMPDIVDMFRVGETIMLGCSVFDRSPWPDTVQDTFVLEAEIVELKRKPSVPIGLRGQDAFGNTVEFEDRGEIQRVICALGRQDVLVDGLFPCDAGVDILGASSDHLIADISKCEQNLKVGDTLTFTLSYGALLACMTSAYVEKNYI